MNCTVCETGIHKEWGLGNNLCEKHDICVTCGIKRKDLTETPWGVSRGAFQCKPCEAVERKSRIEGRKKAGFSHEFTDEIVCPHCGYEFCDSWEIQDGEQDCYECHELFRVERNISVEYTTEPLPATDNKTGEGE